MPTDVWVGGGKEGRFMCHTVEEEMREARKTAVLQLAVDTHITGPHLRPHAWALPGWSLGICILCKLFR